MAHTYALSLKGEKVAMHMEPGDSPSTDLINDTPPPQPSPLKGEGVTRWHNQTPAPLECEGANGGTHTTPLPLEGGGLGWG